MINVNEEAARTMRATDALALLKVERIRIKVLVDEIYAIRARVRAEGPTE